VREIASANDDPTNVYLRTIAIPKDSGEVDRIRLHVQEIEIRKRSFRLRYTLDGVWLAGDDQLGTPQLHGRWDGEDDRGTRYLGLGGEGERRSGHWHGVIVFVAGLDADARYVTLWPIDTSETPRVTVPLTAP